MRRDKSRPVVDKFFEWCDAELPRVLDETPIQAGLRYATNQRVALRRFLDDGRLPAHNNISELNLRRQVLGRRNSLFVGSDDGAVVNTVFVSLLASARLHGIEPHGYLRDLFCLLRTWPADRLLELAPSIGKRLSSSSKLRRSWPPTSSAASCFRCRPDPRIAPDHYSAGIDPSLTGLTERIHPNSAPQLGNFASFLTQVRKNHDRAEQIYERAIQADPNSAPQLGNFAGFELGQSRTAQGLQLLDRAVTLLDGLPSPIAAECWMYAYCHWPAEKRGQALSRLRALVRRDGIGTGGWDFSSVIAEATRRGHEAGDWLDRLSEVLAGRAASAALDAWAPWSAA